MQVEFFGVLEKVLERLHFEGKRGKTKNRETLRLRGFYAGATDPIRTDDLLITSELLYLLSHSSTLPAYYSKQESIRQEVISKISNNPRGHGIG